jgi:hypothetical protein
VTKRFAQLVCRTFLHAGDCRTYRPIKVVLPNFFQSACLTHQVQLFGADINKEYLDILAMQLIRQLQKNLIAIQVHDDDRAPVGHHRSWPVLFQEIQHGFTEIIGISKEQGPWIPRPQFWELTLSPGDDPCAHKHYFLGRKPSGGLNGCQRQKSTK